MAFAAAVESDTLHDILKRTTFFQDYLFQSIKQQVRVSFLSFGAWPAWLKME